MSENRRLPDPSSFDLKIFIKDVHDMHARKRPLTVRPWASIKDVKDQLTKHLHIPASSQAIYFGPLLSSAKELPNHRTLQDAGIYRNGEILLLDINGSGSIGTHSRGSLLEKSNCHSISSLRHQANDICVSSSTLDICPKSLQRLVQQSRRGLALGLKPSLAPDGSGGSYFLSDARKKRTGVFKPADEEPFAENNPRGYVPHKVDNDSEWLRQGIRPGELCLREVAAFLLDHDGFSSVPMTTLAEARHPALHTAGAHWTLGEGGASVGVHSLNSSFVSVTSPSPPTSQEPIKKVGSFQEYVHAECSMDDLSPSKISVDEVHKIAILDIRLMNADRNVANILCQRIPEDPDHFRLVPIDHGYSLRSKCDVAWFDWCWLDWPQLKQPLSQTSKEYVLGLDIEADVRLLQERLNMKNDVLDYFRSSCQILKAGVRAGLTLYDICSGILCRNDPSGEIPSKLETLSSMASELAMSAVHNGRFHHATASLALEEQLATRRCMMDHQRNFLSPLCKFPTPAKPQPVVPSASSPVFSAVLSLGGESAFTDELSKVNSSFSGAEFFDSQISNNNPPPGMVQSSLSDHSSDSIEDDEDEVRSFTSDAPDGCAAAGEWAAQLVAGVDQSMDNEKVSSSLIFSNSHRDRSISESSNSSDGSSSSHGSSTLSKSPVGFWHVRPGSSSIEVDDTSDEEPICWTPSLQPSDLPSPVDPFKLNTEKDCAGSPHIVSSSGFSTSNLGKLLSEFPGISNDTVLDDEASCLPNGRADSVGPMSPPIMDPPSQAPVSCLSSFKPMKMGRSISYSAFSTRTTGQPLNTDPKSKLFESTSIMRTSLSSTQEDDLFRTYLMKFVDLLVVQETERLVQNKAN